VAIGVGLGLLNFLLSVLPLLPGPTALAWLGNMMISAAVLLIVFPVAAVVAMPILALVAIFSEERRAWGGRWLILCLTVILGMWLGILMEKPVRRARFASATVRAEPLLRAIEAHRAATGQWPKTVEMLVPSRLSTLPGTGMMAYPEFRYRTADDAPFKNFELSIICPQGAMSFDKFVYWPEGGYPSHMYDGHIERIADWAYVHD